MSWTASQSLWQEWSKKVRLCLQSLDSQFVLCSIFQHLRVLHAIDIVFFEFYFQRKAQRQKYELLHVASFIPTYSSSFLKSGRPKASFHPPVQMNVSYPRHHFNLTAVVVGWLVAAFLATPRTLRHSKPFVWSQYTGTWLLWWKLKEKWVVHNVHLWYTMVDYNRE